MRGVPRLRRSIVAQAHAVGMAQHGVAFAALGPVAAGHVLVRRERRAISLRARQYVVLVDRIEPARNEAAVLRDDGLGADLVVGRVQVLDAGGDGHAFGVDPRSLADAVLGIDGRRAACGLGAEIGAPRLAAGAGPGSQRLAMPVRTLEAAEVGALGAACAGDEEGHVGKLRRRLLRLRAARTGTRDDRCGKDCLDAAGHVISSLIPPAARFLAEACRLPKSQPRAVDVRHRCSKRGQWGLAKGCSPRQSDVRSGLAMSHRMTPTAAPMGPTGHSAARSESTLINRDNTYDLLGTIVSPNRNMTTYQTTVATMNPVSGAIQKAVHLLAFRNR